MKLSALLKPPITTTLNHPSILQLAVDLRLPATPVLGLPAVTLCSFNNSGHLQLSSPAPAYRVCSEIFSNRRQIYVQPSLPVRTQAVIQLCLAHQFSSPNHISILSPDMISLVGSARKPSTLNKHTSYFLPWITFMATKSPAAPPFPVDPLVFAEFLVRSANRDLTVSPTLSRCSAMTYFCSLAGTANPMDHSLCFTIREGLHRRLGIRANAKSPLLHSYYSIPAPEISYSCHPPTLLPDCPYV